MRNYIQPGNTITLAAPYAVTSGDGLLVGAIFGVATVNAIQGEEVEACLVGVVDLAKKAAQAWAPGDKVYWDDTDKVATLTATDNTLIGAAVAAAAANAATGRVRLNGSF